VFITLSWTSNDGFNSSIYASNPSLIPPATFIEDKASTIKSSSFSKSEGSYGYQLSDFEGWPILFFGRGEIIHKDAPFFGKLTLKI
jgi:hypothetical protein